MHLPDKTKLNDPIMGHMTTLTTELSQPARVNSI